jgi:GT2 family glycosyltransferase/glycosyltransferase involved in cell wall biosynthesis
MKDVDQALRSLIEELRAELWHRELRIQELESVPIRRAVRRSASRRLATGASTKYLPTPARRGLARLSASIAPARGDIQRVAGMYPFPRTDTPLASIVIPVHNQLDATLRCLESIFLSTMGISYEIIVVDDKSDTPTRKQLEKIPRINLISLADNVGYLHATKRGVEAAKGEFIVLLNNDTEVLDGWLEALLDTFADPGVGAVGGKLLLPNLDVQEAGAIVWCDGNARHVGRGLSRYDSGINFARDVDYSSAACLAIRRETWDAIGGFDKQFAPAYYEDVDLCFAVRRLGLRVRYQPAAEVVHHEGTSHGQDATSGTKRFQDINRVKFATKWTDELNQQCPSETPEHVAMFREPRRGTVLVIDHQVPRPDEDAGSMRMQLMIEALLSFGAEVIFACPTDHVTPSDAMRLGQLGVDVVTLNNPLHKRLAAIGAQVDLAILSRPQICLQFLPDIRRHCPNAHVAFDTVDLHYLRERRRFPPTQISEAVSAAFFEIEKAAITASDTTIVVSKEEAEIVGDMVPGANTIVIPTASQVALKVTPASSRSGLMFLGGFAHHPNVDAAVLLATQILPLIKREIPDIELWIVGSNPTPEIIELARLPGVVHVGYLADLEPVFNQVRALVAPLQWGAGVKGKVTQSLAHGIPVITTPIGAEGLQMTDGSNVIIANTNEEFSAAAIRICQDDDLWSRISTNGTKLAREEFSIDRVNATVSKLMHDALPA